MNFSKEQISFPVKPTGKVKWRSIHFHPLEGSNEQFTVGIVAINNNKAIVRETLDEHQFECMFGESGKGLCWLVTDMLENIRTQITNEGTFNSYVLKTSLFRLSDVSEVTGSSIENAWKLIVQKSSCFGVKHFSYKYEIDSSEKYQAMTVNQIKANIKEKTTIIAPQLEHYFSRNVPLADESKGIVIDFLGETLAANFSILRSKNMTKNKKLCRQKLWELLMLRDTRKKLAPDTIELLLNIDHNSDEDVKDTFLELHYEASREDIKVSEFNSIENVASRIAAKELSM